ncbi:outer membrane protein assembly factor BamB family protein [Catenuloplanes indicus]|uniref:Outer membrane protein assembly factor BamB n=1 Tax=Catenuloplanes indicus TaxID=137267 RepID=A0AAE4B070_9ACTN|nr:PQQ-binding-like beta-propeller repeat protein [Catenuloplanes indicus]MDQ0369274.1 outer membrane protein assembly factor BamB [Catenuloplanes indicus]
MIELDLRADPVYETPAPRDWIHGSRWVAVVITLCLLATVAASVPLHRALSLTGAVTVPAGTDYTLTDRRLYTMQNGRDPVVSAFTLTGQRLWQARSRFTGDVSFQEAGDVLLVTGVNRSGRPETLGVDALTGAQRWTLPAQVVPLADGRTGLITTPLFHGDVPSGGGVVIAPADGRVISVAPTSTALRAVDLTDGRDLWSGTFGGSARRSTLPGTAEVVVAEPAGVRVLDARTGAVLRSVPLDGGFAIDELLVSQQLIIVQQARRGGGHTYAFRPDTLDQAWRIQLPGNMALGYGCDDVPCVTDMSTVGVLDPATGAVAYRIPAATLLRLGGHTLISPQSTGLDLSVVTAPDGTATPLPGWKLLLPNLGPAERATAPALLTRVGDGRAWLATLDRAGTPKELGSLAPEILDCQSASATVACRTGRQEIKTWQLRGVRP